MSKKQNEKRIDEFRLLDDVFLRACFSENIKATEYILRVIMRNPNLKIKAVTTQKDYKNLWGRSIVADVVAEDSSDGTVYNIEVERSDENANPQRMRYHSSIIDSNILKPGEKFKTLPNSYVIFITENDIIKAGKPYYQGRTFLEVDDDKIPLNDGRFYLIVNASYNGEDDFGKLMNDFRARNPEEMNDGILKDTVKYFKENPDGREKMSSMTEEIRQEGIQEGMQKGIQKGIQQGIQEGVVKDQRNVAKKMFQKGMSVNEVAEFMTELDKDILMALREEILNPVT